MAPQVKGLYIGVSGMTNVLPFLPLMQLKLKDEALLAEIHMVQETVGFGDPSF